MKQATKRILSALLVLCMVLSVLPAAVFAAPENDGSADKATTAEAAETAENGRKYRR